MESLLFLQNLPEIFGGASPKLWAGAFNIGLLFQFAIVGLALLGMFLAGGLVRRRVAVRLANLIPGDHGRLPQLKAKIVDITPPLAAAILLGIISLIAQYKHYNHEVIYAAVDLLWAWVIIQLVTGLVLSPTWSRPFAIFIMAVAAMDILGILDPAIAVLDRVGFNLGGTHLSLWVLIKIAIMLGILLPLSKWLCDFLEHHIGAVHRLSPRVQVLLLKILKTGLYTVAVLVALRSVGFNFQLLALFSGAVGLGVGFGLQKVVSNLVSGVIILLDNSIRPGDVIEVGGVFGWIESLHSRFISVITRDGTSFLIPNDELISNKVINWSFGGRGIRLKIPVGISYASNVHQAMELMVAATAGFSRVLSQPKPAARLVGFGNSSINLDLRVWIKDPEKGVTNIKSDIQLKIWDLFHEHGIEFPFPQHDLHLKSPTELTVRVKDKMD